MDISRRQRIILQKIVSMYSMSGDPVGSKLLSEILDEFSVSTATLRNEMAELVGMGLLEQPHTSAGRIPTTRGYRYYIDNLIVVKEISEDERHQIDITVYEMDTDPDHAAKEAAKALSDMTGYAAITTTPVGGNVQITHYYLLHAGRYNLAVVGITSVGGIRSRICRVEEELSDRSLDDIANALNSALVFVSAEDISESLIDGLRVSLSPNEGLYEPVLAAAIAIIRSASEVKVFTEGQQHLLSFPELDTHIKELLELFSDDEAIQHRLISDEPLKVYVGDEPGSFGIDSLGIVMGRYRAAGGRHGALTVAGPVRMDYGFVIPRLLYFRDKVSAVLTNPGVQKEGTP